jgi:hypothetical protein
MFSSPGVYAFLVGSGMSTAAGVLTGERIVDDLVRRVARQRGTDPELFEDDPRAWWLDQTGEDPRYDVLLEGLAATDAGRQSLLRSYFERDVDSDESLQPSAAHRALAGLCRDGYVRVVLTTNFDTLIERAFDEAGVSAQVLTSASAIKARIPLVHSAVTLVKLHGDYRSLGLRNTPDELRAYGVAHRALLKEVLADFGLVTIGWSAEWDHALADAIEARKVRRYPMYWATFGEDLTSTARRLIANRNATRIATSGADEFLPDLEARVERAEQQKRRRRTPTIRRASLLSPEDSLTPGWNAVPLLTLRVAAHTSTVTSDELGLIGPEERERIVQTLRVAAFREHLASWNCMPAEAATRMESTSGDSDLTRQQALRSQPLVDWVPVPGIQSGDQARYRLGGDATAGVSALADVRLPMYPQGAQVVFVLDVGVSVQGQLSLSAVANVLRDGLVSVTADLPDAVSSILPSTVEVTLCDVHLVAGMRDGRESRDNDLDRRIDLSAFNLGRSDPAPHVGRSLGYTADIPGPLTQHDAAQVVADGFSYLALAAGFLDPRLGLSSVRSTLGL